MLTVMMQSWFMAILFNLDPKDSRNPFNCCDPVNPQDRFEVVIFKTDVIVGDVPRAISRIFFF